MPIAAIDAGNPGTPSNLEPSPNGGRVNQGYDGDTPQAQTSSATSVLGPVDLATRDDMVSTLRLMPGIASVQIGQRGSQSSLFVRGGNSDDNMVLVDGVSAGDLGGRFDFGNQATTGVESAEVYRGPYSVHDWLHAQACAGGDGLGTKKI